MTQHRINIRRGRGLGGQPSYSAHCTCGYDGDPSSNRATAENDGDEHITTIVRAEGD